MIDSRLIDFTKRSISKKKGGRFKITIETVAENDSLLVSYDITVEDFGDPDYVRVYNKHYNGSRPEKIAQEIIERIRGRNVTNTEIFYKDWIVTKKLFKSIKGWIIMDKYREIAIEIIEIFEELLEKYNIVIDSEERQEALKANEIGVANIYGDEYYNLDDKITNLITDQTGE